MMRTKLLGVLILSLTGEQSLGVFSKELSRFHRIDYTFFSGEHHGSLRQEGPARATFDRQQRGVVS